MDNLKFPDAALQPANDSTTSAGSENSDTQAPADVDLDIIRPFAYRTAAGSPVADNPHPTRRRTDLPPPDER